MPIARPGQNLGGGDGPDDDSALPPGYQSRWEADVVLSDGATMHIRPIVPADAAGIEALHQRLSAETIYFRFFSPLPTLSAVMLDHLVRVDYAERLALVGVLGDEIIGVARYERLAAPSGGLAAGAAGGVAAGAAGGVAAGAAGGPGWAGVGRHRPGPEGGADAEVAFLVDDAHQGRGIGSILLEHLAGAAKEAGITRFVADTLPDNQRMLRVFHEAGFADEHAYADGLVRVTFPIEATPDSLHAMHERERRAAARSVERLLHPRSVAVIGASRRDPSLGHTLLRRLLDSGFEGPVYPVHPSAHHLAGVRAWPSVIDVPDHIDVALIVTPAPAVPEVVAQCARKRVGGLIIISAGFAEHGEQGLADERRLVAQARRHGMRIIGPASMGVVNTDPSVRLNATFSPVPSRGGIGFIAQSGGLGVVLLDELARRGLGVSTFVSAGNKADVSGNDMLHYWDSDPATVVVCMYIESFGNPRTFARVARRFSRRKPIVAVKSGRSSAGTRAAGLTGVPEQAEAAVDALFRQAGVIRTDTLEELFDVAEVLCSQPLPGGPAVAIVANAGGPGVLAADACAAAGLALADLSEATRAELAQLPRTGSAVVTNPTALSADAAPASFALAIGAVLDDPAVDACIAICTMPLTEVADEVAAAIVAVAGDHPGKPVLTCVLGRRGLIGPAGGRQVPSFAFPESAARALGRVTGYSEWLRRPQGTQTALDAIDTAAARRLVGAAMEGAGADPDGRWLVHPAAFDLLRAYGVAVIPTGTVREPEQALDSYVDVVAGVLQDPVFGPLVTLAPSGTRHQVSRARQARALPLTDLDAADLADTVLADTDLADTVQSDTVQSDTVQSDTVSGGDAGGRRHRALCELLERLGRLAEEIPEVAELVVDPVRVSATGAVVAGARVRVAPWGPRPELALRRLR